MLERMFYHMLKHMACHTARAVGRIFTRASRRIYAFFNARYTVGRVTPNSRAKDAFDSLASTRCLIFATCCGLRAGLRPLYLPAFLANASYTVRPFVAGEDLFKNLIQLN